MQGLSQDLKTGYPKLTIVKDFGVLCFKELTEVTTIDMYLLIKIRHDISIQCHGKYNEVENLQEDA